MKKNNAEISLFVETVRVESVLFVAQLGERAAVAMLQDQERVEEIARMLGGVDLTEQAMAHARQMISSAQA